MNAANRRTHHLILLAILVVALILRFRYLTEIEHNLDHAYPIWQAMTTLDRGQFPLIGQETSVLFANPPGTGYLFVPIVALTRSPLGVYVFVVALNTVGVWMTYRAARTLIGPQPAVIAAGLMAVNPWVIEYSCTSWTQCLLPFFVPMVAWLLWPVLMGISPRPARRIILAALAAAVLSQTYLLAYLIVIPIGLLLIIVRRRVPWRAAAVGIGIFTLITAVYAIGLIQNWDQVERKVDTFSSASPILKTEALENAVRLITGAEYELARGTQAPANDTVRRHALSQMAHYGVLIVLIAGTGAALIALRRGGRGRDAAVITLIWFGVPIALMSYTGNPVHPTYQLMGLPAGYVLAAWGASILFRPQTRPGATALIILGMAFAALMSVNSARYYQETAALPGAHNLGALPVDEGMRLGRAVRETLPVGGVVYANESEWTLNSFAGRLFPVVRDARAPEFNIIPPSGGVYAALVDEDAPLTAGSASRETWLLRDGTSIAVDALLPGTQIGTLAGWTAVSVPSAQGITLVQYRVVSPGDEQLRLESLWRIDAVTVDSFDLVFAPFTHVFDEADERILIVDGEGVPVFEWRIGDLHYHRMTFRVPAGEDITLVLGQFDGMRGENVVFLPSDAEPTVTIPIAPDAMP
jgi:4-amino-4-deoxy-L-arabinose transferase-like glycosyltransferase